jgi:hypothetical protein
MKAWRQYIIDKMTNKTTMSIVPLFFNYANETLIANYLEENLASFLQMSKKDSYYILSCKIFQYPNRVISVRLVISMCYKVPESDRSNEVDPDLYQTQVAEDEDEEQKGLLTLSKFDKKDDDN